MARRNRTDDLERDDPDPIASLLLQVPVPGPLTSPGYNPFGASHDVLTDIEDRRSYHPDGYFRDPRDLFGVPTPVRMRDTRSRSPRYQVLSVDLPPRNVLVCIRRKSRREVIFAKRKQRRGAGARRRRRNYLSDVRC